MEMETTFPDKLWCEHLTHVSDQLFVLIQNRKKSWRFLLFVSWRHETRGEKRVCNNVRFTAVVKWEEHYPHQRGETLRVHNKTNTTSLWLAESAVEPYLKLSMLQLRFYSKLNNVKNLSQVKVSLTFF